MLGFLTRLIHKLSCSLLVLLVWLCLEKGDRAEGCQTHLTLWFGVTGACVYVQDSKYNAGLPAVVSEETGLSVQGFVSWLWISQFSFSISFWIQPGLSMVMALLSPPMKVNTGSLIHLLFGLCFSVYWNLNCCFETVTGLETPDWATGWGPPRCGELIYHPAAAKSDRTTQGKESRGASLLFLHNQLFHQLSHVWYWSLKLWVLSSLLCCKGIFWW